MKNTQETNVKDPSKDFGTTLRGCIIIRGSYLEGIKAGVTAQGTFQDTMTE